MGLSANDPNLGRGLALGQLECQPWILTQVDPGTVRWLASPGGSRVLADLPPARPGDELALQTRLRSEGLSPEESAALLLQRELRGRARAKFGSYADGMLFTRDGLEQATRMEVSAHHAGRFAGASLATVHDLGCGIGSDAMALSALGVTVAGVDVDPTTAAVADENLRPWPDSRARVGRAEDVELPGDPLRARVGVWLDPSRRHSGVADASGRTRRVFRLEEISPSWAFVRAVAARVPAVGAKLSPSFPHDALPLGCEAQWTSWDGELVECVVWWGPLVRHQGRSALVLGTDRRPVEVTEANADAEVPVAAGLAEVGRWLYEPDPALTRAGLLGALVSATGGAEVDPGLGYVTSQEAVDVAFARRFEVLEAMPFNPKQVRAWLRERGVTGVTIKKRGIRTDEEVLRRGLGVGRKAGSGEQATLVLTRVAGEQACLVVAPAGQAEVGSPCR